MPTRSEAEHVPPNPGDLIESLRDFGYTLESALADLIDNSITANANRVRVVVEGTSSTPHLAIVDNGDGMPEGRLVEAMRMGSLGPLVARARTDLGRFGLGLKTASLSQGRCLTVITKTPNSSTPIVRRWDLDHVRKAGWQLLREPTQVAEPYVEKIARDSHGTAVVVEQLDRAAFFELSASERQKHLGSVLDSVRGHLGMVFHRFISEHGLEIKLGETAVPAWDPFLLGLSTALPPEKIPFKQQTLEVVPFVLPHHTRLSDDEHTKAGGLLGWNKHQGFYVYRERRLIVPGTWLNLNLKQEDHYKLARIRLDLPNTVDDAWQLNVMKSHVAAPPLLKDTFRRIANDVRQQASSVYRVRGEREAPSQRSQEKVVWRRKTTRTGVRYEIDRSHPVVKALLACGCDHDEFLDDVLSLVEGTIPVAAMLQEPEKAIDGSVQDGPPIPVESLVKMAQLSETFLIHSGQAPAEARRIVLSSQPFLRFREEILAAMSEALKSAGGAK